MRLAMLVAKLRWQRSLGTLLFDTCLLDFLTSRLALIAAAIKVVRCFDSGANEHEFRARRCRTSRRTAASPR
jgi:hypothetical protein